MEKNADTIPVVLSLNVEMCGTLERMIRHELYRGSPSREDVIAALNLLDAYERALQESAYLAEIGTVDENGKYHFPDDFPFVDDIPYKPKDTYGDPVAEMDAFIDTPTD